MGGGARDDGPRVVICVAARPPAGLTGERSVHNPPGDPNHGGIPADLGLPPSAARLRAQEIVLRCLCKVIATLDPRSSHAVAVSLEVAELEQAESTGEDDEVVRLLRRFREQFEEPRFDRNGSS